MRARWKLRCHFLCFGPVDPAEEEAAVKTRESSAGSSGTSEVHRTEARCHRRHLPRQNRSREEGKHPNRSVARKDSDDKRESEWSGKSSYSDNQTADAIFSSSSWTSSSTSSSSCLSSPELRRKKSSPMAKSRNHPPLARAPARNYGSATGLFLLLLSLSVMMFCGRLYAILWTSSWLCFVPRRNSEGSGERHPTGSPELRRKGLEKIEKKRIILEGLLERNQGFEQKNK